MSRLNYILSRHRTQSRTLILVRTQYVYWVRDSCPWFGLARHRRSSGSKLFSNFESRWERERETSACIRISCILEKYHEWVLKSFSCASAFARQSRIFDGIDALYAFYRIPKCLNWRNILSWIPFGSDLDPNSNNVFFFFFKGERIQISPKAGHHRPASETPFHGVSLACRWWPNVECWLGCSENFRGFDLVLLRGPDPCPPSGSALGTGQCIHLLRYTEHPFYRAHRLLYDTLQTIACTNF